MAILKNSALGACALVVAATALLTTRVADPDTWWMIAGGRIVLDGSLPTANVLSHTYPDHPWVFTQWLLAALLALAERQAGLVGVQGVQIAFVAAAFILVVLTARRLSERTAWWGLVPLLLLAIDAARFRFAPKGELASLLGLALVAYVWARRPRHLPLWLGGLAALWVNLHAGAVFGLLQVMLLAAGSQIGGRSRPAGEAGLGVLAFGAGSLCSPGFAYPYRYMVENLQVRQSFPMGIAELSPPPLAPNLTFYLLLVVSCALSLQALRRRRIGDVLLVFAFGALAVQSRRFIGYFAVVVPPLAALGLGELVEDVPLHLRKRVTVTLGAGLAVVALAFIVRHRLDESTYVRYGRGGDFSTFPAGACDFIEARGLSGRMFNEFNQGGYLAWRLFPRHRVFVDGRGSAYPWSFFEEALSYRPGDLAKLLDRYGVGFAVVQRRPLDGDIDLGPAFERLGWPLVYLEGSACVFVRPGSLDAERTLGDVFQWVKPWQEESTLFRAARQYPSMVSSELRRISPEGWLSPADSSSLGGAAYLAGDAALAERFLSLGARRHPSSLGLRFNYGQLLERTGRREAARAEYREVARRGKGTRVGEKALQGLASP